MKIKEFDTLTYEQAMQHLQDVFNAETYSKLRAAIEARPIWEDRMGGQFTQEELTRSDRL